MLVARAPNNYLEPHRGATGVNYRGYSLGFGHSIGYKQGDSYEGFQYEAHRYDWLSKDSIQNLQTFTAKIDREEFIDWLDKEHKLVQIIFHIGARTDTAEFDKTVFDKLNLDYTKSIWRWRTGRNRRLLS